MTRIFLSIGRFTKRFYHARSAAAAVEFAMVFPIFLTLLIGVVEMGNYIIARIKTDNAAYVMDLVASTLESGPGNASAADFVAIGQLLDGLLDRYDGTDNGGNSGSRLTAINLCPGGGTPVEVFQVDNSYNGSGAALSKLDADTLQENQGAYMVEVSNTYSFIFANGWLQSILGINLNLNLDTNNVVLHRSGGLILHHTTGDNGCP